MTSKCKVNRYVVGSVQTNCYIVINEENKEAIVIDPGDNADLLSEAVQKEQAHPVAVLLTHGHFDHAGAAKEFAEKYGISIYAYEDEKAVLESEQLNVSWMIGRKSVYHADIFLKDEQEMELAGFSIRVFHTPGHTPGGCCYYFPYEDVVFVGDTLFCQSVGRSDLPGGSASELIRGIREKLMVLPEKTAVYPGHNEETTIENERMYNPYL